MISTKANKHLRTESKHADCMYVKHSQLLSHVFDARYNTERTTHHGVHRVPHTPPATVEAALRSLSCTHNFPYETDTKSEQRSSERKVKQRRIENCNPNL